ncbi:hypothetical protein FBULB1_8830 [Fusarium bulbicola]|nr:hypothetical protein FBULB1_8830 [Fusarium bulbicola]
MSFLSKAHLFSALLLLLEILVYLEDLLYEVLWFRWRSSSTTILAKLFLSKEDEIWHAIIYGDDGDVQKIFEDLTNFTASSNVSSNGGVTFSSANHEADSSPGKMEAGVLFNSHRTKLQEVIATDVTKSWAISDEERESTVKARLESIADQPANSSRRLTEKELLRLQVWSGSTSSTVSILWTAINRGHKSDVDYLLKQRNQKLYIQNGNWKRTVLHETVSKADAELTGSILEGGSSTSPQAYINAEDSRQRTALHILVDGGIFGSGLTNNEDLGEALKIFDLLSRHGANINALDGRFRTPLNLVLSGALIQRGTDLEYIIPLINRLLESGAEVSTKDMRARMAVCDKSAVYSRNQQNDTATETSNPFYWTATDKFVPDVLYPANRPKGMTFFAQCENECQAAWDDLVESPRDFDQGEQKLEQGSTTGKAAEVKSAIPLAKDLWRWVNLSANNITWVRDFIKDNSNIDATAWGIFRRQHKGPRHENQYISNQGTPCSLILTRKEIMSQDASESSKNEHSENTKAKPMVSLTIPFIDIETEDYDRSTTTQGEEAYSPLTGFDGVQMPQTLDQTSINAESVSKLRCKENQVIYRWSRKQYSTRSLQIPLEWRVRNPFSKLTYLLRVVRRRAESCEGKGAPASSLGRKEQASVGERAGDSTGMQRILKDRRPKWLMVRQLWLWRINDGDYFLFSSMCMADDLLETIKRSNLHEISDVNDLMKHIVQETIKFPARFRRAGLGEHILDIFESEIASEADEEATFYNNFAENEWDSKQANRAINCTWRVKDIRDELGLIRNVFTSQLKVVKQISKVLAPHQPKTSTDSEYIRNLVSELESLIARIGVMDSEANKTTNSLSNISQAMLAQAALKEAEAARFMNFIILPFTIVTVIFTPLSFMTSLFAVNSDGFPHKEDGELRIPSDWFWKRMVIGEFGTLIPLFIFVLFLYHSRRGPRNHRNGQ